MKPNFIRSPLLFLIILSLKSLLHPHSNVLTTTFSSPIPQETLLPTRTLSSHHLTSISLSLLVIPISYANTNITLKKSEIETLFFSTKPDNYYSVKEYYLSNSQNKLQFKGYVVPPGEVVLRHAKAYYHLQASKRTGFLLEIAHALGHYFKKNPSPKSKAIPHKKLFDRNHDHHIDIIVLLHAGESAETLDKDQKNKSLNSHAYSYRRQGYNLALKTGPLKGLYFGRYIVVGEYNDSSQVPPLQKATIGTICHELGHCLGLVDLYNTSLKRTTEDVSVGRLALMGTGYYNTPPPPQNGGAACMPAPLISFHKILLGWEKPTLISSNNNGTYFIEDYSSPTASNKIYKVIGYNPKQYWLLEYRKNTGFDKGMLIWHINEDLISLDDTLPPSYQHYFLTKSGINNHPLKPGHSTRNPFL